MGSIDWLPIADMPEAFKDGREVLLWDGGSADVGTWTTRGGAAGWIDPEFIFLSDPTHFAEITPP